MLETISFCNPLACKSLPLPFTHSVSYDNTSRFIFVYFVVCYFARGYFFRRPETTGEAEAEVSKVGLALRTVESVCFSLPTC